MTLTLAFTPPGGWVIREQSEPDIQLKGTDAAGNSISCKASALTICKSQPGSAQTEVAPVPHPKGDRLHLQGKIRLTLAADITLQPRHRLSLTEPSEFSLGGIPFKATPAAANSAKSNQEKGQLQTAEVTLSYPDSVHILHICRIWEDADIEDSPAHRQELTGTRQQGKNGQSQLHLSLWDTQAQETIEIVTCGQIKQVDLPIDLHMNLGGQIPETESPDTQETP